jgi:hypothetical protein
VNERARIAADLGMKEREIIDVQHTDAGLVVTTHDRQRMIRVSTDRPDAAGQTGWMWLVAPSSSYRGPVPVFDPGDLPLALAVPGLTAPAPDAEELSLVEVRIVEPAGDDGEEVVGAVFIQTPRLLDGQLVVDLNLTAVIDALTSATTELAPGTVALEIPAKVADVVEWIGDNPERARAALAAEGPEKPRKGVVTHAEAVLAAVEQGGTDANGH